jgi:hypothetical protein
MRSPDRDLHQRIHELTALMLNIRVGMREAADSTMSVTRPVLIRMTRSSAHLSPAHLRGASR